MAVANSDMNQVMVCNGDENDIDEDIVVLCVYKLRRKAFPKIARLFDLEGKERISQELGTRITIGNFHIY